MVDITTIRDRPAHSLKMYQGNGVLHAVLVVNGRKEGKDHDAKEKVIWCIVSIQRLVEVELIEFSCKKMCEKSAQTFIR